MRSILVASALSLSLLLPATPARATWSIVLADSKTGEVAVGTATCLNNLDIKKIVPVIRVGLGAGAAQALLQTPDTNKKKIWDGLGNGLTPAEILAVIQSTDPGFAKRQFGIVDLHGQAATHTGANTQAWAGGVTGQVGSLTYSIQGNILTGEPVVLAAQAAIVNAPGDLAAKLMAAMEAARSMGGDGRCSCSPSAPTSCGSPPAEFEKSAHIGCMVIARIGDVDGACTSNNGCAQGSYYMALDVFGPQTDKPDPVIQLQGLFAQWRESWKGRPDHLQSKVDAPALQLVAGGPAGFARVRLVDWQGVPVGHGGATISTALVSGDAAAVVPGPAIDHGDGTYDVPLSPGTAPGSATWRFVADDGISPVTLYPFTTFSTAPKAALAANSATVSVIQGGALGFTIDGTAALANRHYVLLGSVTGTVPGFDVSGLHVPLNADVFTAWTFFQCGLPPFTGSCGVLDAQGRATATLAIAPMQLRPLHFHPMAFSVMTLEGTDYASDAVEISIGL